MARFFTSRAPEESEGLYGNSVVAAFPVPGEGVSNKVEMRTFGLGWGMAVSIFLMGCLPGKVVAQGENQSWTGAVAIESVGADQVLIAVDTLNEGRPLDGVVDRVFWYTAQAPLESWLSYKFDHANLGWVTPAAVVVEAPRVAAASENMGSETVKLGKFESGGAARSGSPEAPD